MFNLNNTSTYGAHSKAFDSRQVRTVLINLTTILEWYLAYKNIDNKFKTIEWDVDSPAISKDRTIKKKKTIAVGFGIVFTVLFIIIAYSVFQKNNEKEDADNVIILEKSIAVLPFRNLSKDSSQIYFCDGFMEEVLNHLQKVKAFSVRSRTSSYIYKESLKTLPEIAKELNVNYIIEGSVARQGNDLKIWVQLINTKTDEHIWSEDYNREIKQVFTIQSDIAKQIAQKLKAVLSSGL